MIGKQQKKEITRKAELLEELRLASFDKVAVFENASSIKEVENYMRQNRQYQHSVIVVSHR